MHVRFTLRSEAQSSSGVGCSRAETSGNAQLLDGSSQKSCGQSEEEVEEEEMKTADEEGAEEEVVVVVDARTLPTPLLTAMVAAAVAVIN